jgi:hypothetical protein
MPAGRENLGTAYSNGYVYAVGGFSDYTATAPTSTVYYASLSRIKVSGSLDLLASSTNDGFSGINGGGTLRAGDTTISGILQVQDQANFNSSVNIVDFLNVDKNARVGTTLQVSSTGALGTVEKFRVNTPTTVDNSAAAIISQANTTDKILVLQAKASTTGAYLQWQDSTGTAQGRIANDGSLHVAGTPSTSGALRFTVYSPTTVDTTAAAQIATGGASNKGLVVQGAASQTANLQEWQKSAGTADGVTAIQMDVKISGVTPKILGETLAQAKKARLEILSVITKALPAPRPEISPLAPLVLSIRINPAKIGLVIGPGGKTINGIIERTGALAIDIDDDGLVFVSGKDKATATAAYNEVKSLVKEYEVGEIIEGPVVKILEFGAIVQIDSGHDGMIHVSELKNGFVKKVEDVVKMGDIVKAKIMKVEPNGKIGLSLKALENK